MHTPEAITGLSDEQARNLLADLARNHYGHDRWKTQLGADTGYTREAVMNWHREGNRPPALVIMWLEVTLRHNAMQAGLTAFNAALKIAPP